MSRWHWPLCAVLLALVTVLRPAPVAASQDDVLLQVQQRIQPVAVLRGEFAQEKILQGFRNPLRSSGRFLVARDAGVIWDTRAPFPSQLVIGEHGVRVDGVQQVRGEQPAVARINRLLVAAIAGELPTLRAGFSIDAAVQADGWTLKLQPKDPAMAQVIVAIELGGNRHVERVELLDADGNRTAIRFSAQSAEPAALTADEAARFD